MITTRLLHWLFATTLIWPAISNIALADFLLDAFTTPTSEATSNIQASVGQTVTGSGLWDGRREFNITASFNVDTASLNIANGTLTHIITPNAPSPLASMMLKYVDLAPTDTLPLPSGNILIENVSASAAWNLTVTLRGSNLPGGTLYAPNISSGFSGNLLIPLNQFPSAQTLGTLNEVQFDFVNTSGGQLSFGPISITSVPEPTTTCLLVLGCSGIFLLRKTNGQRQSSAARVAKQYRVH